MAKKRRKSHKRIKTKRRPKIRRRRTRRANPAKAKAVRFVLVRGRKSPKKMIGHASKRALNQHAKMLRSHFPGQSFRVVKAR